MRDNYIYQFVIFLDGIKILAAGKALTVQEKTQLWSTIDEKVVETEPASSPSPTVVSAPATATVPTLASSPPTVPSSTNFTAAPILDFLRKSGIQDELYIITKDEFESLKNEISDLKAEVLQLKAQGKIFIRKISLSFLALTTPLEVEPRVENPKTHEKGVFISFFSCLSKFRKIA